jgi:hypothetical protein
MAQPLTGWRSRLPDGAAAYRMAQPLTGRDRSPDGAAVHWMV